MKYQLTVICPGIRTKNWLRLYHSVATAFMHSWEIIFVGPYDLPDELKGYDNVRYIKDWGSPMRCQQIGLMAAEGVFTTWAADDGFFLLGSLSTAFEKFFYGPNEEVPERAEVLKKALDWQGSTGIAFNHKRLVMGKYYEGNNDGDMPMQDNDYYCLSKHDASRSKYLPDNYLMLNVGLVPTVLLREVGGWDCSFEVCPMAYNDLAIRLQNYGVEFMIQDEMMFRCSHLPGHAGDHGPIHDAQIYHDQPLFLSYYRTTKAPERVFIELDNWEDTADHWERRFGKKEEKQ